MKQIRRSVFETNSSSTHSLVITGGSEACSLPPLVGKFDLSPHLDAYGWGYDELTTWQQKLAYVVTYYYLNEREKQIEWLFEMFEGVTGIGLAFSIDAIGYIDHQSLDMLDWRLNFDPNDEYEFKSFMENLIFGVDNKIIIDNDNW